MAETKQSTPTDYLLEAMRKQLGIEADKLLKEAQERLERRAPEIIAGVLVDIMAQADMQTHSDRVIFTIRKK